MIGEVLDETYRVVERLGAGSMGEVYLVEHVHLGRREAIKVLRAEMAADPRLASRFRREARAINRLRHRNIIGIYDFGQLPDGRLYLTMEYASGEPVDALLRRLGRLDVPSALHLLHQLASAMDHAHGQGVVHRDLKPTNLVLVAERGRSDVLKVLDFGLAKVMSPGAAGDQLTLRGELFGTPEYMAPERLAGGADDPRSDLYAIGCLAFELLTGKPPFTGPRNNVLAAHMQAPVPAPGRRVAGVPGLLDVIVQQLMTKDPDQRLQSAKQLSAAIEQVPGFPRRFASWGTSSMLTSSAAGFERDTERALIEDEVTIQDSSRGPRQIAFADTASARTEEVRDEILGALVDLARAIADQFPGDEALSLALALVHGARDDRARILGERTDLEDRQNRSLQTAREREGSLRFAIAELRFERQKAAGDILSDLDYQIAQLDQRVRELTEELQRDLAHLDERGIELAAAEHDLEGRWLEVHRRLRAAVGARVAALGAAGASMASRLDVIGGAVDELLAIGGR
jgi:serine/threonine protein kinase